MLAAGILIGAVSGICSLGCIAIGLTEGAGGYFWGTLPIVLMVGGIPFAIGVGLFFGGRALLRSARRDEQQEQWSSRFE